MAPLNTRQAAVIEPILSTQARGYQNSEFIAQRVLPIADIPNRNMRVIKFGKEAFRRKNTRRAPGSETKRIEPGYASDPVSVTQEALEGLVPIELMQEANSIPGIDLGVEAVREVQDAIQLGREVDTAKLVLDPANYSPDHVEAMTAGDLFTDPTADTYQVIQDARETVRRKIGRKPNLLTLSPACANGLKQNERIKAQFKYTSAQSVTLAMMAQFYEVAEVIVGEAVELAENAKDEDAAEDIWGEDALLTYSPSEGRYRVPAFGYTYRLEGYPMVEVPYYENNRKAWVYPVTEEYSPNITGKDAGFLFKGAGATA